MRDLVSKELGVIPEDDTPEVFFPLHTHKVKNNAYVLKQELKITFVSS